MVMHLGEDVVIFTRDIVALFDLSHQGSADTRAFLSAMQDHGMVRRVSKEAPKSAILTQTPSGRTLYLSPITTATLHKRAAALET